MEEPLRPKRKTYSSALRRRAVSLHLDQGRTIKQLARELDISESTLRRWVSNTLSHGGPDRSSRHAANCACMSCWRRDNT
ncbi:MAG: transposase [Planctomycetes bacterium]|nr:transposase [Planctomycetota bacterium]